MLARSCLKCQTPFVGGAKQRRYCETCRSPSGGLKKVAPKDEVSIKAKAAYDARRFQSRRSDPSELALMSDSNREWRRLRPARRMLFNARQRARRFSVPIDITIDDIIIPTHCPILGIELACGLGRHQPNSPSLDRTKPHLGYVKGNVSVISLRANRIKNDASLEDLIKLVKYMKGLR